MTIHPPLKPVFIPLENHLSWQIDFRYKLFNFPSETIIRMGTSRRYCPWRAVKLRPLLGTYGFWVGVDCCDTFIKPIIFTDFTRKFSMWYRRVRNYSKFGYVFDFTGTNQIHRSRVYTLEWCSTLVINIDGKMLMN